MDAVPNIKIGVLYEGKLINEISVDEGKDVSIGTDIKNLIMLVGSGLPERFPLLQHVNGKYYLSVYTGIRGKIFEPHKTVNIEDVYREPEAVKRGNVVLFPLSMNSRGSLTLGDNTLLFKIVPAEPIPRRLPPEFRGSITDGLDKPFVFILLVLFVLYAVMVEKFSHFEMKSKDTVKFEDVPEKFARLILDKPIVIKEKKKKIEIKEADLKKVEPIKKEGAVKTAKKEVTTDTKMKRNFAGTKRAGGGADKAPDNAAIVRTSGIIGILGSKGKSGNLANLFNEKGFGQKIDKALKGVAGLSAGKTLNEARMQRGAGKAKGVDIGELKSTTGSGAVAFGSRNASAVNVLGNLGEEDMEGEGTINPAVIAKTLAMHIGAFQYCYNVSLRSNPRLAGELKVRFTIMETGKVQPDNISFSGPAATDRNLTSCVHRVFLRIKFPQPKGGDVTVNYPLNFTSQN